MRHIRGWTVVFKGDRWKADVIAAALAADGLEAEVFDDQPYGNIIDAQVMVPDGQASTARRLIKEAESRPAQEEPETEPGDV